ncbi:nucleotidyltransferase substrate binding protein [uncultured Mucilaginibacter sp.]|uniref:nucleotidyltransferase substrate binding protein n=1 Tax=uncultured Mucilaginibacter sp. TaxID=797541 RepID=UPI0025EEBD89|nr:nucleotidyltransferase substrate binding protein [uncultured Mucilaginibacter sp.]
MENKDIRWKQRFQNFEKAFLFFETAVDKASYTPIEVGGLVQAFEFTYELGWKTIKDFLYEQGLSTNFPREAIKEGFQTKIIEDGHTWLQMLEKRNEFSHTYNETVAKEAVKTIKYIYYPAIGQVYRFFKDKTNEQ